jgi:hypothetical protein
MTIPGSWPSNPNASLMSAIWKKRVMSIYCTAQTWKLYRPMPAVGGNGGHRPLAG